MIAQAQDDVINSLVESTVVRDKAKEMGFDTLNEEEQAEGAAPEAAEEVAGAPEEWYKAGAPGGYPYSGSDDADEEPAPFILIVPEV